MLEDPLGCCGIGRGRARSGYAARRTLGHAAGAAPARAVWFGRTVTAQQRLLLPPQAPSTASHRNRRAGTRWSPKLVPVLAANDTDCRLVRDCPPD